MDSNKETSLVCKYCSKVCKNANSFRNHERTCPSNANRRYVNGMTGKKGSNQFIKSKKEGLPLPKVKECTRQKMREANLKRTPEWNKENGKLISKAIRKMVEEGKWHTSLAKHMHISYKGVNLHGTWELKYAMFLDSNGIDWVRNTESFLYIFDNKERRYTPDFYLTETNEYVEIKGYKTEKDEAKWSYFPNDKTLIILMKKDLLLLGIDI